MYRYTADLVSSPADSPPAPQFTTPDVQILDISSEEPPSHSSIFPSPSHETIYMSISDDGHNDDNASDNVDNTTDGEGEDKNSAFGDGGGDVDQSLETVFRRPSQSTAATIDSDTDSEISDEEEEESQQPPVSPLPNPGNSGHSIPSSTQPGRSFDSVINLFLTRLEHTVPLQMTRLLSNLVVGLGRHYQCRWNTWVMQGIPMHLAQKMTPPMNGPHFQHAQSGS